MINRAVFLISCLTVALLRGTPVSAQTKTDAIEVPIGWTAPVDESLINHFAIGFANRLALTRRVSVGPELFYFRGPRTDQTSC